MNEARAESFLDSASALIRRFCGQTLSLVEDDEVTLPKTYDRVVNLPETPVVEVTSVEVDGSPLAVDDYTARKWGLLLRSSGRWDEDVTVTYTHGYAEGSDEMAAIKAVCLQVASRALTHNRDNLEEFGGASEAAGFPPEVWLSPSEKMTLAGLGGVLVG